MICPVCKRELAPTLSICLTCGAMMNDTVREELQSKIAAPGVIRRDVTPARSGSLAARPTVKAPVQTAVPAPPVKRPAPKAETSDLSTKKTSQTLAEFKTKNATIPDWRLQLQNSIRQRTGRGNTEVSHADAVSAPPKVQTRGANALKADYIEQSAQAEPMNLTVANAMKRIEESRRAFLLDANKEQEALADPKAAPSKNFPFNVVSRSDELPAKPIGTPNQPASGSRPKLVSSLRIEKKKFDTNKLVPIPEAADLGSIQETAEEAADAKREPLKQDWSKKIEIKETTGDSAAVEPDLSITDEADEIDDLAPIAMRFNAGLFDLIIGGFATLVVISPFLFASEGWISLSGFFAFAAVLMVVMFIYLTGSLSYLGRTFGMKLFSLELVDAEQSGYPTTHQAAVSSSVYLLSIASCGLGFLPMLFNEEKRAAHDLASGTILIREL